MSLSDSSGFFDSSGSFDSSGPFGPQKNQISKKTRRFLENMIVTRTATVTSDFQKIVCDDPKDHESIKQYLVGEEFERFVTQTIQKTVKDLHLANALRFSIVLTPAQECVFPNISFLVSVSLISAIPHFFDELLPYVFVHPLDDEKRGLYIPFKVMDPLKPTKIGTFIDLDPNGVISSSLISLYHHHYITSSFDKFFYQQLSLHQFTLPRGFKHQLIPRTDRNGHLTLRLISTETDEMFAERIQHFNLAKSLASTPSASFSRSTNKKVKKIKSCIVS